MYKCQITGKYSRQGKPASSQNPHGIPGEKLNRIVVETREKEYFRWVRNEETNKWEQVFVAKGWEIVREINASDEGLALWNSWTPEERATFLKHMN